MKYLPHVAGNTGLFLDLVSSLCLANVLKPLNKDNSRRQVLKVFTNKNA